MLVVAEGHTCYSKSAASIVSKVGREKKVTEAIDLLTLKLLKKR